MYRCTVCLQMVECSGVGTNMLGTEAMTCQELLALSGALSAALPTGQLGLGSFFTSLSKGGKFLITAAVLIQKGGCRAPGPLPHPTPSNRNLKKTQIISYSNVYINQRDAQILINNLYFFVKRLYVFRTTISPSSGATFNKLYRYILLNFAPDDGLMIARNT